jgi:hypothetical protein
MDGGLFPLFLIRVLPSTAITPAGAPVSDATQATKHRWNFSASSVAKMSPS